MCLGMGSICGPLLGGALASAGDDKYPGVIENQAYDKDDPENLQPEKVGGGFAYAADVMSMVCLIVCLFYTIFGWLCRPKSNFEKMLENEDNKVYFDDQEDEPNKPLLNRSDSFGF